MKLFVFATAVAAVGVLAALPGRAADGAHAEEKPAAAEKVPAASHAEAKPSGSAAASGEAGKPATTPTQAPAGAGDSEKGARAEKGKDENTASAPGAPGTQKPVRHGPALLRYARPTAPPPPPAPKPGEDPPPPSPLTMDALRQDMKRGKDSGGISPDAPARTKVEQVLAEMVKTRAAMREDASRLESLTGEGGGAEAAGAPGAAGGPAVPGQPPQKNPLDVLAKALRGIKPDQAAPIVARIDRNLAATVLLKMPPVDAGKIMGALKPDVAAEVATLIALRAKPSHAGVKR